MEIILENKTAVQDEMNTADTQQSLRAETDKKIAKLIAQELQVRLWQVEAAVSLIDEGNTIPFIARYRKEATGTLDDEQLRTLDERLTYLRNLEEKKEKVLESIEAQGKLTAELRAQIEEAQTQVAVEDLYRPFRPKRRTRASVAKEKGLQGLADWLLSPAADPGTGRKRPPTVWPDVLPARSCLRSGQSDSDAAVSAVRAAPHPE